VKTRLIADGKKDLISESLGLLRSKENRFWDFSETNIGNGIKKRGE